MKFAALQVLQNTMPPTLVAAQTHKNDTNSDLFSLFLPDSQFALRVLLLAAPNFYLRKR